MADIDYIKALAASAMPVDDSDYGSNRQIIAENDFFDAIDLVLTGNLTEQESNAFDQFCHNATSKERIDEGIRLCEIVNSRTIQNNLNSTRHSQWPYQGDQPCLLYRAKKSVI